MVAMIVESQTKIIESQASMEQWVFGKMMEDRENLIDGDIRRRMGTEVGRKYVNPTRGKFIQGGEKIWG